MLTPITPINLDVLDIFDGRKTSTLTLTEALLQREHLVRTSRVVMRGRKTGKEDDDEEEEETEEDGDEHL